MKTVSAYTARVNFGELLNEVYYKGEEIVIERKGKPMARIIRVKKEENSKKNNIFKLAGILSDAQARKMEKMVYEGRRDGSRYKKFLAKW